MSLTYAAIIGTIFLLVFGGLWWWVSRQQGELKDDEKKLRKEALDHARKLSAEADRRKKVAAAKPVGDETVEAVRKRVRNKRKK